MASYVCIGILSLVLLGIIVVGLKILGGVTNTDGA